MLSVVLGNLADNALTGGDLAAARAMLDETLALVRRLGHKRDLAITLGRLGQIALHERRLDDAERLFGEGFELARDIADATLMPSMRVDLAEIARHRGRVNDARREFRAAIEPACSGPIWDPDGLAAALEGLAALAYERAEHDRVATGAALAVINVPAQERLLAAIRDALGAEAFEAAWSAGRALDIDAAVAEALWD